MKYTARAAAAVLFILLAASGTGWAGAQTAAGPENGEKGKAVSQSMDAVPAVPSPAVQKKTAGFEDSVLLPVDGSPLTAGDFSFSGVSLGEPPEKAEQVMGNPISVSEGSLHKEYRWSGLTLTVNRSFPYRYMIRGDLSIPKTMENPGVSRIYADGQTLITRRGISVGARRENVIRTYGAPEQVLWDGTRKCFYFVYSGSGHMLVFTVRNDKVSAIEAAYPDARLVLSAAQQNQDAFQKRVHPGFLYSRDFSLAGYTPGHLFQEPSWDMWEKKVVNSREEIWYYPGYAVRMSMPDKKILMVFLRTPQMITSRGLAVGDQLSTMEELYGAPQKMDTDVSSDKPKNTYFYISPNQDQVLIFYADGAQGTIQGVLASENDKEASLLSDR